MLKTQTKRLVAVHGWSGMLLGLFLYVVVLTGSVAVFSHEIALWSASHASEQGEAPLAPGLDAKLRELASTLDPAYLEEVTVFTNAVGHLQVFFHTHEVPEGGGAPQDKGVRFIMDPVDFNVLERSEGLAVDLPPQPDEALDRFIVTLHVNLHAPNPWGLYLTGILGLVMLAAAISGILMHKHLLRDLFTAPRWSNFLLNRYDRHILAGSWSVPFSFVVAFTGAFFSFAGTIGLPVVAMVAFGGDQVALIETVLGAPAEENASPATLTDLDALVADSTARAGGPAESLTITHWGRADAVALVGHAAPQGSLSGITHRYGGSTGAFEGTKPLIGTSPSVGNAVVSLIGPLHFGSFAGLLSKLIWASLGVAACYVTLTGLQLWAQRRSEVRAWQWMQRAIVVVGYGMPLALVGAAAGFFLTLHGVADTAYWTAAGFLAVAALAIGAGVIVRTAKALALAMRIALGVGLASLPVLRLATGGAGWDALLSGHGVVVLALDLTFLLAGAVTVLHALGVRLVPRRVATQVGASSLATATSASD